MRSSLKTMLLPATLALISAVAGPSQAALTHDYELQVTFADSLGGPALSSDGGTLTANGYAFGADQGLNVSGATLGSTYGIDMVFELDAVSGYRKLIDFKNLATDDGLYVLDNALNFYPIATGPTATIAPNQTVDVLLNRSADGQVTGYVDGVQQIQFMDTGNIAAFDTPGNLMRFFEDDTHTGGREASSGFVDSIKIYDAPTNPVPEASTLTSMILMLAMGFGSLVIARRKASLRTI